MTSPRELPKGSIIVDKGFALVLVTVLAQSGMGNFSGFENIVPDGSVSVQNRTALERLGSWNASRCHTPSLPYVQIGSASSPSEYPISSRTPIEQPPADFRSHPASGMGGYNLSGFWFSSTHGHSNITSTCMPVSITASDGFSNVRASSGQSRIPRIRNLADGPEPNRGVHTPKWRNDLCVGFASKPLCG